MKRTAGVGVAVAAVAVAGWVGGTWYTGKRIEETARKASTDANATNTFGITLEWLSYERGVFSSTSRYRMTVPRPGQDAVVVVMDNKINHGPLPLDRLARAELKPVSATSESFLVRDEGLGKELKTVDVGATIRANSVIDYDENVAFDLATPAMRYEQDGGTLELGAGRVEGSTVKATTHVKMNGTLASVRATSPAPGPLAIDLRNLTMTVDSQAGRFGMQVGDSAFRIGGFSVSGPTPEDVPFSFTGDEFGVAWHMAEDEKFVNAHLSYNLGKLAVNKTEIGDIDLRLVARQLDGVATAKLVDAYRAQISTVPAATGPDATRDTMATLRTPINEVLAGKPSLALDSLIWTTPLGQSKLTIDATLMQRDGPANPTPQPRPDLGFENAALDLSVSQAALIDTIARFTKTGPGGRPITLAQANEQATQQLRMMLQGATQNSLVVVNQDKIESQVTFDGTSVLVNGKEPPPQLLRGLLQMVP